MRILEEFISKLGKFIDKDPSCEGYETSEILFHLYNMLESLTNNGSDLKNTFVLYSVKNNPNKGACEQFKNKFIKVYIIRVYVNNI